MISPLPFPCAPRNSESEPVSNGPDLEELQSSLVDFARHLESRQRSSNERECRIRNFRSERYDLVDDLIITLEERDGQFVASSLDTEQFGHGFSQEDALINLCSVIEDYYEMLLEDEGRLSSVLESHLRYLKRILRERQ